MPTITSISPTSGPLFTTVVITGTGFSNVGPLDVMFGGVSTSFTIDSDTQITAIAPSGSGTVPVTVRALLDGISNSVNFTYTSTPPPALPPILVAIVPPAAAAGSTVTLIGIGLSGATAVNFGATPGTIVTNTDTEITVTVPPGTGLVPVTVVTPNGTSNALGFFYTVTAPLLPILVAIVPSAAPAGTTITLTGIGLSGATAVNFGATPGTIVTNTATQITVTVPPGAGLVPVTVVTPNGTSNALPFIYTLPLPPVLVAIVPPAAPAGTTITLTGTGLSGATAVFFGATPGTIVTNTATQITVTVPPGTGLVPVTVVTPNGTSNALGFLYTTPLPPVLVAIVPPAAAAGTTITLTGIGLSGATAVNFGATAGTIVTNTDTQITVTVPPGTGIVPVTVVTPNGTSAALPFIYV